MKNIKGYLLFAAVMVCFGSAAHAVKLTWQKSDGVKHGDNVRHEDVVIEKGQIISDDVVTDKSITINGVLDGDAVSVGGGSVTVNGAAAGDVVSIGGPVLVRGSVKGDVASMGGPVSISGRVWGDIASMGGKVELSGTAEVDGDISSLGGSVVRGEKTVLKGEIHNFDMNMVRDVLPRILKLTRTAGSHDKGPMNWIIGGLIGIGLLIFFSVLATGAVLLLLPAVFFPKNVENAAAAISGDMWKTCWIGALLVVGFLPGLLMMLVSILGIPLIPFALILCAAAGALGLSAFSVVLQGRFFEGIKKAGPSGIAGKVFAGYALMAGLLFFGKLIPFVGGILSLVGLMLMAFGTMLGLGAVWLTRMGNRNYTSAARSPAQTQAAQPGQ